MMKVYMSGVKTRSCGNPIVNDPPKDEEVKAKKVGLGLANMDKLMSLNIKKKKSKNIAFEL